MIFAKRAVAGEEIAHRVILALQRLWRRDAGYPAEFFFGDDPDLAGLLSVEYFRSFELVRRAAGCRAVGFGRIGGVGRLRRRVCVETLRFAFGGLRFAVFCTLLRPLERRTMSSP